MKDDISEKLPQNIQHLLMEIGEKTVLFRLFLLTKDTRWEVYQNLNESGCDIVLVDSTRDKKIKIEVKTRQKLYSTAKNKRNTTVQYTLTKNEYDSCNFAVCYWLEMNAFFIIPVNEFRQTSSNGKPLFVFRVRRKANQDYDEKSNKYLNNWNSILT